MARRKKKSMRGCVWFLVIIVAAIGVYFGKDALPFGNDKADPVSGDEVQFHFIDVGQADAALIRTAAGDILIDAGTNSSEDELKAYLDSHGVTTLEYAIFTHPHEDHIGGADMVIRHYEVKRAILPDVTSTTQTFANMMDALEERRVEVIQSKPGTEFKVGELSCTVLAPLSDKYSELNSYSVVLRAVYGETSVLFTGDAETDSEEEMLAQYRLTGELNCDILKVGHHGSDTSSADAFIKAVSPTHAVISCGEGNKHGHPVQEILERYEANEVLIYRTDREGSIVFTSTGGEPERLSA